MTTLTDDELLAWLAGFGLGDGPHAEVCRQFSARFRELLAQQEWQPIETAPKDGTKVILWPKRNTGQDCYVISYWHTLANPNKPGMWVGLRNPTHWRPLPTPPKDG